MFNSCCHENKIHRICCYIYYLRSQCSMQNLFLGEINIICENTLRKVCRQFNLIGFVEEKKNRWANLCKQISNTKEVYEELCLTGMYRFNALYTTSWIDFAQTGRWGRVAFVIFLYKLCVIDCSNHRSFCFVYLKWINWYFKRKFCFVHFNARWF